MTKQVHKFSLEEILIGNITKQTDDLSTQVDDVLIRVRIFLMKNFNDFFMFFTYRNCFIS